MVKRGFALSSALFEQNGNNQNKKTVSLAEIQD